MVVPNKKSIAPTTQSQREGLVEERMAYPGGAVLVIAPSVLGVGGCVNASKISLGTTEWTQVGFIAQRIDVVPSVEP